MKKISLIINVDNYLHNTPQKIKHDLHDMFGGLEDLFEEAIQTIQGSLVRDVFDLKRTRQVLWQHAYETISAMLQEEDVSDQFIDKATTGFRDLCIDLHDAVIPHIAVDGVDLLDIHVAVDEVDTMAELHNGDVGEEVTIYITCNWGVDEPDRERQIDNMTGLVDMPDIRDSRRELAVRRTQDTTFRMDEEQLYDWAPRFLHPFVQGVMIDVITSFLKYGMKHPENMRSRSDVCIYHVVWQSLKTQLTILSEEVDTMDQHSYNQDVIEIYYCYEDHLKYDSVAMNSLVDKIASYVTDFFYTPGDLRAHIWGQLINFKNAIVYRSRDTITFRLLAK